MSCYCRHEQRQNFHTYTLSCCMRKSLAILLTSSSPLTLTTLSKTNFITCKMTVWTVSLKVWIWKPNQICWSLSHLLYAVPLQPHLTLVFIKGIASNFLFWYKLGVLKNWQCHRNHTHSNMPIFSSVQKPFSILWYVKSLLFFLLYWKVWKGLLYLTVCFATQQ